MEQLKRVVHVLNFSVAAELSFLCSAALCSSCAQNQELIATRMVFIPNLSY